MSVLLQRVVKLLVVLFKQKLVNFNSRIPELMALALTIYYGARKTR